MEPNIEIIDLEQHGMRPESKILVLARELGAVYWANDDDRVFMAAWTRLLAAEVERRTFPQLYKYGDKVRTWAAEIMAASDGDIHDVCERVHKDILEIDYDDGWPTDRAGNALNAVCLGQTHAHTEASRWPAHASQHVWGFVTGATAFNAVTQFSRQAWQRMVFAQATALAAASEKGSET